MSDRDPELEALFAQPAPLPDSKPLLREILVRVDRQQRRRSLLLWSAAFAGALPLLLLAAAAWPSIASGFDSLTASMNVLLGREIVLPQLSQTQAQYGVWTLATLGLMASAAAAVRSLRPR